MISSPGACQSRIKPPRVKGAANTGWHRPRAHRRLGGVPKLPVGIWQEGVVLPLLLFGSHPRTPSNCPLFLILLYFRLSLADLRPRLLLRRSPFPHVPGMGGSYRFYSTTQHHGAAEPEGHDASPRAASEPRRAPPGPQCSLKTALNRNKTTRPPFFLTCGGSTVGIYTNPPPPPV